MRERGESCSELPGHCVSVNIWGLGGGIGGARRGGGVELAVVKIRGQKT